MLEFVEALGWDHGGGEQRRHPIEAATCCTVMSCEGGVKVMNLTHGRFRVSAFDRLTLSRLEFQNQVVCMV